VRERGPLDRPAEEPGTEFADDRFDFGKLGHARER
jgi:hypothetical protein